jgi:hypothetical protein
MRQNYIQLSLTLLLTFSFIYNIADNNSPRQCISLNKISPPVFSAQFTGWKMKKNNSSVLSIKTTLSNNSADTLSFMSMSNAWIDSYTTDTSSLVIDASYWTMDVPVLIKIAPDKSVERDLNIVTFINYTKLHTLKFRIGFHLVNNAKTQSMQQDFMLMEQELKNMKNVIWSDTLDANTLDFDLSHGVIGTNDEIMMGVKNK